MLNVYSLFFSGHPAFYKLYIHTSTVEYSHAYRFAMKLKENRNIESQRIFKKDILIRFYYIYSVCLHL